MDRTRAAALLALAALSLAALAALPASSQPIGLPATVESVAVPVLERSYETLAPDGTPTGETTWRVVQDTGNCCENYVYTTPDGTILDFGGTYPYFSEDGGRRWQRVKPDTPLVSGEGTLAFAPNGDILGIGWDPYTGDHLQSFKYDAAADQWLWAEQPLHTPFYDREWVAVVPGPIEVGGLTTDYAVVLRGGYPSKDVFHVSTDGITYETLSDRSVDAMQNDADTAFVDPVVGPYADYAQTLTYTNLTPLGEGAIMTGSDLLDGFLSPCDRRVYTARGSLSWACHAPQEGEIVQWHAVDSSGRLHATEWSPAGGITYVTSADGGRTVDRLPVPLPAGYEVQSDGHRDLKANAAAGVVAIAAHAANTGTGASQDFVFVYRYPDETAGETLPVLERIHRVGLGDLSSEPGVTASGARFDFANLAILPDGRIVTSFNDSENTTPAIAIQLTD